MGKLVMFLFRLLYVMMVFLMAYPFVFLLIVVLGTIWTFNPKGQWEYYTSMIGEPFYEPQYVMNFQESYEIYRSPWTYLLGQKETVENPDYNPYWGKKKPKEITDVKVLKNAVQEVLDKA